MPLLEARQIALLSVLTAVSLGIQLAPRPIPNVESTSLFTFLVGILYGSLVGGFFGGFVMFVNGFLSPWGYGGLNIPFQMVGMATIGVAGGVYKRYTREVSSVNISTEVAVLGGFLTLFYDIITNVGVAVPFMPRVPWHIALISVFSMGTPLALVHIVSNIVLFRLGFVPLLRALQNVPGGKALWLKKEHWYS